MKTILMVITMMVRNTKTGNHPPHAGDSHGGQDHAWCARVGNKHGTELAHDVVGAWASLWEDFNTEAIRSLA